jgi:hypothetical protein
MTFRLALIAAICTSALSFQAHASKAAPVYPNTPEVTVIGAHELSEPQREDDYNVPGSQVYVGGRGTVGKGFLSVFDGLSGEGFGRSINSNGVKGHEAALNLIFGDAVTAGLRKEIANRQSKQFIVSPGGADILMLPSVRMNFAADAGGGESVGLTFRIKASFVDAQTRKHTAKHYQYATNERRSAFGKDQWASNNAEGILQFSKEAIDALIPVILDDIGATAPSADAKKETSSVAFHQKGSERLANPHLMMGALAKETNEHLLINPSISTIPNYSIIAVYRRDQIDMR